MKETRITSETGGQKGQKLERHDLISELFLEELATVCGIGAEKYDDDNWRKGYSWRLSFGALKRHLRAFWTGEDNDPESELSHLAHAAWHCMALYIFAAHPEVYGQYDDRPDLPELTHLRASLGYTLDQMGTGSNEIG